VVTTVGDKDTAQQIARALVEERLAGCVQVIGPITSTYWWNEQVESAEEFLCLIKTRRCSTGWLPSARCIHTTYLKSSRCGHGGGVSCSTG
jgi:uncharacterized protein involved in tolerance to divalent cations